MTVIWPTAILLLMLLKRGEKAWETGAERALLGMLQCGVGQCCDRHPQGGSLKLSEVARVKKWVCRFGIYKHMGDGHTHGPAGDH